MNSNKEQHKQDKKNSSWQGGLFVAALTIAALAAVADTYGEEVGKKIEQSEVPVPVVEPEPKKGWWSSSMQAVKDKLNEKELMNEEIEALNIQLRQAHAELLGFDKLLDAAAEQNDRTVAHFDSLLAKSKRDVEAYRHQNEVLDTSIKDLEAKDSSMIYVEGCWVSSEKVQTETQ